MGICESKLPVGTSNASIDMFLFQSELGRGGFSKVLCGVFLYTKVWHAVKIINKTQFSTAAVGQKMIFSELEALKRLALSKPLHPFVANLHFAFHDRYVEQTNLGHR